MAATLRTFLNGVARGLNNLVPLYNQMYEYQQQEEMMNLQKEQFGLQKEQFQFEKQKYEETTKPYMQSETGLLKTRAEQESVALDLYKKYQPRLEELNAKMKEFEASKQPEQFTVMMKQIGAETSKVLQEINNLKQDALTQSTQNKIGMLDYGWKSLSLFSTLNGEPEDVQKKLLDGIYSDSPQDMFRQFSTIQMKPETRMQILGFIEPFVNLTLNKQRVLTSVYSNAIKDGKDEKEALKVMNAFKPTVDSMYDEIFSIIGFKPLGSSIQQPVTQQQTISQPTNWKNQYSYGAESSPMGYGEPMPIYGNQPTATQSYPNYNEFEMYK